MTPEEFERIKNAEKEHLRALKKLKEAVRRLERSKSVADAVRDLSSSTEKVLDTHAEMIEKLAVETARREAQLELAMSNVGETESGVHSELEVTEEELQRIRARDLVRQLKRQMGSVPDEADEQERSESSEGDGEQERRTGRDVDHEERSIPDKTIGRMK